MLLCHLARNYDSEGPLVLAEIGDYNVQMFQEMRGKNSCGMGSHSLEAPEVQSQYSVESGTREVLANARPPGAQY